MTALRAVTDAGIPLGEAVAAYLRTLDHPESRGTRKQYGSILGRLSAALGDVDVAEVAGDDLSAWMGAAFAGRKPATWNLARTCLRSAWSFFGEEGMAGPGVPSSIRARVVTQDRDRAVPADVLEQLLGDRRIALREKVLWRMLLESAARESEVLNLDAGDLDQVHNRAPVRRKGSAGDVVVWQSGTARLLPRLLKGRRSGPVFTTSAAARAGTPRADVAPDGTGRLSARQAQALFREATEGFPGGPWTLHGIRHRALTDAAEAGASTAMLLALSGHKSVRSLAVYARVGADALAQWQAQRDPARRH